MNYEMKTGDQTIATSGFRNILGSRDPRVRTDGSTGRSTLRSDFTTPLYVLIASTGLVLLIACANVANLLIARAGTRQREMAVRLAIGATRKRIVVQLMVESLMLSVTAAIVGLQIGVWMNRMLLQFLITDNAQLTFTTALDDRVLGFSVVVAFATAFIFGLVPALQATKLHISGTLKNEAGNIFGASGHARLRKVLVTVQVSLSLLLLITSSLFVRSLQKLHELDPGFRKDSVITFSVDPELSGYTAELTVAFSQDLLEGLRAVPGVSSVGQAVQRVLDGNEWRNGITVAGYTPRAGERVFTYFNMVGPSYFATLGIPLLAGREFEPRDLVQDAPRVCIVNEAFARKYFPNGNALGSHVGEGRILVLPWTLRS